MNASAPRLTRLLIIEPDPALGQALQQHLNGCGHRITLCESGRDGLAAARAGEFDLVVLEAMLPGVGGAGLLEMLLEARPEQGAVPVILVSAHDGEQQRIEGLRRGADDYLAKPFSFDELEARISAILRRVALERLRWRWPAREGQHQCGELRFCRDTKTVALAGQPLALTETEFRLLYALCTHCDQILSKAFLYQTVLLRRFGRHDRALDLHVSHLRRKLSAVGGEDRWLRTVWGQGYMFSFGQA